MYSGWLGARPSLLLVLLLEPRASSGLLHSTCPKASTNHTLPNPPHTAPSTQAPVGHRSPAWPAWAVLLSSGLQALHTRPGLPHHHLAFFDGATLPPPSILLLTPHHVGLREDEHGGAGALQFLRGQATEPGLERSRQAKGTTHHGARAILASPTTSPANQHRPRLVRGAALATTGGRRTDAAASVGRWCGRE